MLPTDLPPIHPGEMLLEEFLTPLQLTQAEAARRMGIPLNRLNEIIRGKRGVTAETALLLSELLDTTPESTDPADQLGPVARETRSRETASGWRAKDVAATTCAGPILSFPDTPVAGGGGTMTRFSPEAERELIALLERTLEQQEQEHDRLREKLRALGLRELRKNAALAMTPRRGADILLEAAGVRRVAELLAEELAPRSASTTSAHKRSRRTRTNPQRRPR